MEPNCEENTKLFGQNSPSSPAQKLSNHTGAGGQYDPQTRCQAPAFLGTARSGREQPTAASHGTTGSNRRQEEGPFAQLKKHSAQLAQGHRAGYSRAARDPRSLNTYSVSFCNGKDFRTFSSSRALFLFISYLLLHF